jgi:hypothetical protein
MTLAGALVFKVPNARLVGPIAMSPYSLVASTVFLAAPYRLREPAPDDLICDAFALSSSRKTSAVSKKLDAVLRAPIHDGERIFFAGLRAEVHRAQTQALTLETGATQSGCIS